MVMAVEALWVPAARPVVSIRHHLQGASLLAVLAGYVVLLLVNRQLATRVRHERHDAQVRDTTRLLQQLLPEQTDTTAELQRHLADLASPSLLVWMVWMEPDPKAKSPVILSSGAVFQEYYPGHALIRAADAALRVDGVPSEFHFNSRTYFTCAMPIRLAGQTYSLRFLQDFTFENEQDVQRHARRHQRRLPQHRAALPEGATHRAASDRHGLQRPPGSLGGSLGASAHLCEWRVARAAYADHPDQRLQPSLAASSRGTEP